jgi:hypothetical protein
MTRSTTVEVSRATIDALQDDLELRRRDLVLVSEDDREACDGKFLVEWIKRGDTSEQAR